jgi:hypothetical protein
MSEGSTPSSDGSALPSQPPGGVGGSAAGFELNLGDASILARRLGKKSMTEGPGERMEMKLPQQSGTEVVDRMKGLKVSDPATAGRK